ncbi:MAG: yfnF, partial [Akkermansiaceae bacterium]|nr:yfnF [Akkermansiaceae bacterium]
YNSGLFAVSDSERGLAFVNWWKDLTGRHAIDNPPEGMFVDQRFLDAAPALFPECHILRDPAFNVAWFNLHERRVTSSSQGWLVNGRRLALFHFTFCDLDRPGFRDGIAPNVFEEQPDLRELLLEYGSQLKVNGNDACRRWPYTYATFRDGTRIRDETRREFRRQLIAKDWAPHEVDESHWQAWQRELENSDRREAVHQALASSAFLRGLSRVIYKLGVLRKASIGGSAPRGTSGRLASN